MEWFCELNPVLQALLATLFTWFVTALGAGLVVFTRRVSQRYLDAALGMAAGVMIAASFWSLLAPAIEMAAASPLYGEALQSRLRSACRCSGHEVLELAALRPGQSLQRPI